MIGVAHLTVCGLKLTGVPIHHGGHSGGRMQLANLHANSLTDGEAASPVAIYTGLRRVYRRGVLLALGV